MPVSVLNTAGHIAGHQIQSSVAQIMERQGRFIVWAQLSIMGDNLPCDLWSTPVPDAIFDLETNADGYISTNSYDLASVPVSNVVFDFTTTPPSPVRVITFRCPVGVKDITKVIYLHNTDPCAVDQSDEYDLTLPAVRVYLLNQNDLNTVQSVKVAGPDFYVLGGGQLKYIMIENGKITGMKD